MQTFLTPVLPLTTSSEAQLLSCLGQLKEVYDTRLQTLYRSEGIAARNRISDQGILSRQMAQLDELVNALDVCQLEQTLAKEPTGADCVDVPRMSMGLCVSPPVVEGPTVLEVLRDVVYPLMCILFDMLKARATTARHSEDFSEVLWFGTTYKFNVRQAALIEVLWLEWERDGLALFESTVLQKAKTAYLKRWEKRWDQGLKCADPRFYSTRIANVLGKHTAYNEMLEHNEGRWKLSARRTP